MCLSSRALLYFGIVVLLGSSNALPIPGVQQAYGPMEMVATVTATGVPVLDPACVEKYYDTLLLPPVMPKSAVKVHWHEDDTESCSNKLYRSGPTFKSQGR